MPRNSDATVATIGIDIGKNAFHVVGLDRQGAIILRQRWTRGQIETRMANMPPCLIGMEASVGSRHLSQASIAGARRKGQKNDFPGAEAIVEAAQRPTMKFVATKTTDQIDLQALRRVRERLVHRFQSSNPIRRRDRVCTTRYGRRGRD